MQTYTFDSFGNTTASSGSLTNPFQYTARELDSESGVYFYRASYYNSNTGRFLSDDPLAFGAGVNFFTYVENDPTLFIDPSGLHSIFYDGRNVRLFDDDGRLRLKCKATSGRPGGSTDPRAPWEGPIPIGAYLLDPGETTCVTGFRRVIRDFGGLRDWGRCRVPLHPFPETNTFGRSVGKEGFFIHGGVRPGSAGCIDVGDCDQRLFDQLRKHSGPIRVDVKHTHYEPVR